MKELGDLHVVFLGVLSNGLLGLFHKRLFEQHAFGIVATQPAFHHLVDDVLRLALLKGGFAQMDRRMADLASQMSARMGNVESGQRWGFGLYAVLILAVLGLYFKGTL